MTNKTIDPEVRHKSVKGLHDIMQAVRCNSLYSLAEAVLDAGYTAPTHPIIKVLNDPQAMKLVVLKATVAQQAQMIEWLKKGRSEEVVWRMFDGEGGYDFTDDEETAERWKAHLGEKYSNWLTPFYTSPPAPVAVPHADIAHDRAYRNGLQQGYILGIGGHEESYQQMMTRYNEGLHEAKIDKVKDLKQ